MIINFINVVMIIYTFSIDLCACVCGGGGVLRERKVYDFWVTLYGYEI